MILLWQITDFQMISLTQGSQIGKSNIKCNTNAIHNDWITNNLWIQ